MDSKKVEVQTLLSRARVHMNDNFSINILEYSIRYYLAVSDGMTRATVKRELTKYFNRQHVLWIMNIVYAITNDTECIAKVYNYYDAIKKSIAANE